VVLDRHVLAFDVVIFLSSPRIFGSADEPKRDLPSLERRHRITIDQRDLSPGMVVHPVDAACRDEVARLDDKVLHADSIRGTSLLSKCQKPRRGLVEASARAEYTTSPSTYSTT
jgi:hypothetical protein